MSNWTKEQHEAYELKRNAQRGTSILRNAATEDRRNAESSGAADESDLHTQIIEECERRGWIALHGSMAHRTYRTPGEPDFIVMGVKKVEKVEVQSNAVTPLTPDSITPAVWFIECKTRTGKLSIEQQAMILRAAKLGHTIHVVRSFEEFIKVIV